MFPSVRCYLIPVPVLSIAFSLGVYLGEWWIITPTACALTFLAGCMTEGVFSGKYRKLAKDVLDECGVKMDELTRDVHEALASRAERGVLSGSGDER